MIGVRVAEAMEQVGMVREMLDDEESPKSSQSDDENPQSDSSVHPLPSIHTPSITNSASSDIESESRSRRHISPNNMMPVVTSSPASRQSVLDKLLAQRSQVSQRCSNAFSAEKV